MAHDLVHGKTSRDWSLGSVALPVKQERRLMNKVDDVRYDVRQVSKRLQVGLLALSGAVGLVAVTSMLRERP